MIPRTRRPHFVQMVSFSTRASLVPADWMGTTKLKTPFGLVVLEKKPVCALRARSATCARLQEAGTMSGLASEAHSWATPKHWCRYTCAQRNKCLPWEFDCSPESSWCPPERAMTQRGWTRSCYRICPEAPSWLHPTLLNALWVQPQN